MPPVTDQGHSLPEIGNQRACASYGFTIDRRAIDGPIEGFPSDRMRAYGFNGHRH